MQAYEDWLRHKADRAINDRVVKKVTVEGGSTDIKAKKVSNTLEHFWNPKLIHYLSDVQGVPSG